MGLQIKEKIAALKSRMAAHQKERNRVYILAFSSLFLLNYLMFCLHTNQNIFNIFPSIPMLDDKKIVTIYLPYLDGKTILKEEREVPQFENEKNLVKYLFQSVVKGRKNENTANAVPVNLFVRKIWIHETSCIIDVAPSMLESNSIIIEGSESTFREAVEKTIVENIPSIKKVLLLGRGIPGNKLWEI
ncbi:MAG: hypothetical protein GY754_31850 [bacterium]|nr:hypothetical protein [bacterium]